MTTKYRIAEQALNIINKGPVGKDSDFGIQSLMLYVTQALADVVRRRYFEGKADDVGFVDGGLIITFRKQPVLLDGKRYYAVIPSSTVSLPRNMGYFQIYPTNDPLFNYVAVPTGFAALYSNLEAFKLGGKIGYEPIENEFTFHNMTPQSRPKTVDIRIAAGIDGDPDKEFNMPSDIEKMVIDVCVERYLQTGQKDLVNDNVDA